MNAKEQEAIGLLNSGMNVDKVVQKTGLSKTWLILQQERTI